MALVGADSRHRDASLRVLALVDAHAPGPWPEHWFAVLPVGVGGPMLVRAVDGVFDDLDRAGRG